MQPGMLSPAKAPRQIVFMRRPTSLPDARKTGQSLPTVPVLLEHAPYDPIYSITGITPSMTRFEKLFAALSQAYISSDRLLSGLLRLIGYFEEAEHSRFCLLYALPTHFGPVDIESPRMPTISMLSDLLCSHSYEPSLEVKYGWPTMSPMLSSICILKELCMEMSFPQTFYSSNINLNISIG